MVRRAFAAVGVLGAAVLASAAIMGGVAGMPAAPVAVSAQEDGFTVDAVHSTVIYRVKHMNASWSYGRFNDITGTFDIAEGGSINITVKTDSVDSGNEKRDGHLKSPDFFSAKEFPEINFKSSSIKKTGESTFEAIGQLTLRGVTKDVTVAIDKTGEAAGRQGKLQGFEAKFTVKRTDFGVSFMPQGIGEDVTMIVSLEGAKK